LIVIQAATGCLLDWECGPRDAATLKKLVDRLARWEVTFYCTYYWGPTIIGTKTYAKPQLLKGIFLGHRDYAEAAVYP
jgi:hypothetical protein